MYAHDLAGRPLSATMNAPTGTDPAVSLYVAGGGHTWIAPDAARQLAEMLLQSAAQADVEAARRSIATR